MIISISSSVRLTSSVCALYQRESLVFHKQISEFWKTLHSTQVFADSPMGSTGMGKDSSTSSGEQVIIELKREEQRSSSSKEEKVNGKS